MESTKDPEKTPLDVTPTALLLEVLEKFGEAEPRNALVLWLDEEGNLSWRATSASLAMRVGMIESAKHFMLERAYGAEEGQ